MNIKKAIRKWLEIPTFTEEAIVEMKTLRESLEKFNEREDASEIAARKLRNFLANGSKEWAEFLRCVRQTEDGAFLINGSVACTGSLSAHSFFESETDTPQPL